MPSTLTTIRVQFFDYLFGDSEGFICIATGRPTINRKKRNDDFKQSFFQWPAQRNELSAFIEQAMSDRNVWFCTSLLERAERKKEYCLPGNLVWADLDTCSPNVVSPPPSCIIESSPRRWQAIWRLEETLEPYQQEDFSRRIAYIYTQDGADPSGWDLTQLLRVPLTSNFKYEDDPPEVKLVQAAETLVPVTLFETLPRPSKASGAQTSDFESTMPDPLSLPDVENVLYKYLPHLGRTPFRQLYLNTPADGQDWSRDLWRLINICIESGMSDQEVFAVAIESKCNKYARDNRPIVHLWEDVVRASEAQSRIASITAEVALNMPDILTEEEIANAERTFIDDYTDWAKEATDAIPAYHELAAAILLSSVMANGITLLTSYGPVVPNLWGLILGDSTLTRKTTAMRMAMDILMDVDPEILLATDGSAEGLLTGLSTRPHRVSIFYKDEVSGFIDSINRKDYLAGMPETLTQLYDVPRVFTRRLRKETITITSPVFIFFGGGIRDKVYSLVTDEYVSLIGQPHLIQ